MSSMTSNNRLPPVAWNWIGFALVLLGLFVLNYNYLDRLDLISDDDDLYFMFGMDYLKGKYRGPDDGALYCLWQLGIQLMTNDAAQTFYVNWLLMNVLPTVGFYWLLRSMRVNVWVSVWVTLCYTFSLMNYPLAPKLTHFTIAILLAGLIVVRRVEGTEKKLFFGAFTIWLASYVRPEMYVGLVPIILWLAWISYRKRSYKWLGGILAITILSGLLVGTPIRKNDRSFWTFKHHFSINYVQWYPETNLSPWNHFNEITTQAFGHKLTSPLDAFLTKPDLVMRHFFFNVGNLFKETFTYLKEMFWGQLNPIFSFPRRSILLLAIALALLVMTDYRATWKNWQMQARENGTWLGIMLVMLFPSLLSTTIIFPRIHYVLYHFVFYIPLIGVLVSGLRFRRIERLPTLSPAVLAGINLVFIGIFLYPKFVEASQDQPTPNRDFAELLNGLDIQDEVRFLSGVAPFTYPRYVSPNWQEHYYYDIHRPENFARFVQEKDINCVIVNKKLNDYFSDDAGYVAFQKAPSESGFELVRQTPDYLIYTEKTLQ